jgi:hypothetical protein
VNVCAEQIAVDGGLGKETPAAAADDFESAIARIESAVVDACDQSVEWPARITAGIGAALDFMIANPVAARALTIDSRSAGTGGTGQDGDYAEMIGRFAALLGAGAPRADRLPASSDRSVVAVIAAIVSCHVRAGTVDQLGKGDPNLVFLALLPYLGFAEASRWSAAL